MVLSSLALHNIRDGVGREHAIEEIVRVTKPSGRVAILDMMHTDQYERVLRENGMEEVGRSGIDFLYFPPLRAVRAVKPLSTQNT